MAKKKKRPSKNAVFVPFSVLAKMINYSLTLTLKISIVWFVSQFLLLFHTLDLFIHSFTHSLTHSFIQLLICAHIHWAKEAGYNQSFWRKSQHAISSAQTCINVVLGTRVSLA